MILHIYCLFKYVYSYNEIKEKPKVTFNIKGYSKSTGSMKLCPSEIRYSQDSICHRFLHRPHNGIYIGESLDDLIRGKCAVEDFPTITVTKRDDLWYCGDNRRLWVFKKAHELGKIRNVPVYIGCVDSRKFTTKDKGASIQVRGDPGGSVWRVREKEHNERIAKEKEQEQERLRKEKEEQEAREKERLERLRKEEEFEQLIQRFGFLRLDPDENPFLKSMGIRKRVFWRPLFFGGHEKQPSPLWTGLKYSISYDNFSNIQRKSNVHNEFRFRLLCPTVIHFTNTRLYPYLNDRHLLDYVEDIHRTRKKVNELTPLQVFFKSGFIVTAENEKLWILKFAHRLNMLDNVIVEFLQDVPVEMQACSVYTTATVPFLGKTLEWTCACKLIEKDTIEKIRLRPSCIRYSIPLCHNRMSEDERIGEFLDKLLEIAFRGKGQQSSNVLSDLLTTSLMVVQSNFSFYTLENRKLWILKTLEGFGLCLDVPVAIKDKVDQNLLRHTFNVDDSCPKLFFDGDLGGHYWKILSWLNNVSPPKKKRL